MEVRLRQGALCFTFLLCLGLICFSQAQQLDKLVSNQNPCISKLTCHDCIQTPTCAWCALPEYGDKKRCFQPSLNADDNLEQCPEEYVYNPANVFSVLERRPLAKGSKASQQGQYGSSSSSSSSGSYSSQSSGSSYGAHSEAVQISPQHVSLKLRINEAYRMLLEYAQADDYPVDLYYLMDLSNSMRDDKDSLSSLGEELSQTMGNITSKFRLGFGSFVDKVVMPYVSMVPKKLIDPCGDPEQDCIPPYGYKNQMPLNENSGRIFSDQVKGAKVSGNLDGPEGGFDAIMQAIVCTEQIGWREKARRLLVFSTDAGFHHAGDGKLGGIVKPNDGLCHLDRNGMYAYSTLQDYPSISQINMKVKQNAINLIFAVTKEQIGVYDRLKDRIEGSSSGQLTNDSSNVVDLVKDQYNKISSSIEMKDTASSAVKVTYWSKCLNPNGPSKQTHKCDGLKVGTVVQFEVDIEVTACPANRNEWNQTFLIYPVGINETLRVDLEMQCECPCERPDHNTFKLKSPFCSGYGTFKCGVCECDTNHFGKLCECDQEKQGFDITGCKPDANSTVECSGRGTCLCNQCVCDTRSDPNEKITGQHCECDNFSCDRHNGLLCSGPGQGSCVCGKCVCAPGWTGPACDCKATNEACISPEGGEVCSGHGVCECGVCKCQDDASGRYSGRYCEKCPTCMGRCLEFKHCVQCQVYKTGPLSQDECAKNCSMAPTPTLVKKIEENEAKDENLCVYFDEDECKFEYVYSYDAQGKIHLRAQEQRECPPHVYILGLVLGVIGAIVLIGLAFLCLWKVLTSIHDRREFAKFEKERMLAKWDTGENPIYRQATSTFKNPTYAGK
uniref:Integrin beta n=1 Tax=Cacopsylla melanoneura TaxID=428564 RepID=A0A8D8UPU8_9HEMI